MIKRYIQRRKLKGLSNERKELLQLAIIAFVLSFMFGFGWTFGLLVHIPSVIASTIAQYIFSIVLGMQGVLFFIFHGLRSNEARREWRKWFYKVMCCLETPPELRHSATHSTPAKHTKLGINKKSSPYAMQGVTSLVVSPSRDEITFSNATQSTYMSPYDALKDTKKEYLDGGHEVQTLEMCFNEHHPEYDSSDDEETVKANLMELENVPFSETGLEIGEQKSVKVIANIKVEDETAAVEPTSEPTDEPFDEPDDVITQID